MLTAVVPAHKEEFRLGRVLETLLLTKQISQIFVILNGSNRATCQEAHYHYLRNRQRLTIVSFQTALGIDVPRAVGACLSFLAGADYTLFVDGDMAGELDELIHDLVRSAASQQLDLALTDCYPNRDNKSSMEETMLYWRSRLNEELGVATSINVATPSHGPHIVSRQMLARVPYRDFAVPPTLLFHATNQKMRIDLAGEIPHIKLGSSIKNSTHNKLVVDTIIGDCLETLCMHNHGLRKRSWKEKVYLGYHDSRRFDILEDFLAGRKM